MRSCCSVFGLVLAAGVAVGAGQRGASEPASHLAAAKAAQAAGDVTRALREYAAAESALERAGGGAGRRGGRGAGRGRSGTPSTTGGGPTLDPSQDTLRYEVMLNHARLLVAVADQPPPTCENCWSGSPAAEAERLYRELLGHGTTSDQNLARNELGTLMLKLDRARDAATAFNGIKFDADPSRRYVYRFNVARGLEAIGDIAGATSSYVAAAADKPEFEPAVDAAIVTLGRKFSPQDADRLVWTLLHAHQLHDVDRATEALLPMADSNAPSLLAARLMWEVEAKLDRDRFKQSEQVLLRKTRAAIGATVSDLASRSYLDDALAVPRDGEGPLTVDFYRLLGAPTPLPGLNAVSLPAAFARVVKHTGDLFEARELHQQALARYLYAWAFDQGDEAPAVYAAMLIKEHPDLDPEKRALNALINRIFAVKGVAIAADDVPNSFRLHVVLGTIFEKLGNWLPEEDSHTALFQWKAAVSDEERIRRTDPSRPASPGTYMHLAECYRRAQRPELASKNYSLAGDAFKAAHRDEEAARAYQLARQ
jgi:tetratricopeptide (TPR) repeat protein